MKKTLTKLEFAHEVEAYAIKYKINLIDATIKICENNGIEVETVNNFMHPSLKEKIREESKSLNLIESENNIVPIC